MNLTEKTTCTEKVQFVEFSLSETDGSRKKEELTRAPFRKALLNRSKEQHVDYSDCC